MDEVDIANQQAELMLSLQLRVRRAVPKSCGACHNCSEPLPEGRLFCDVDCRDDYDRQVRK